VGRTLKHLDVLILNKLHIQDCLLTRAGAEVKWEIFLLFVSANSSLCIHFIFQLLI